MMRNKKESKPYKKESYANSIIAVIKKNGELIEMPILETVDLVFQLVTLEESSDFRSHIRLPDLIPLTAIQGNKPYKLLFNKRYIMYVIATNTTAE